MLYTVDKDVSENILRGKAGKRNSPLVDSPDPTRTRPNPDVIPFIWHPVSIHKVQKCK